MSKTRSLRKFLYERSAVRMPGNFGYGPLERRFREQLKSLMNERGLSQYRLSAESGISQQNISRWLAGAVLPRMDQIERLAAYFGVSINELLPQDEDLSHLAGFRPVEAVEIPVLEQPLPELPLKSYPEQCRSVTLEKDMCEHHDFRLIAVRAASNAFSELHVLAEDILILSPAETDAKLPHFCVKRGKLCRISQKTKCTQSWALVRLIRE
ncbi:MAG: helix-turn-helix transcriptional regulator [Candidatus Wallbacteria bacterium]|nr:helix-turn-helix transcriptional regulator [Candidatus Wallbacteria bacterium]